MFFFIYNTISLLIMHNQKLDSYRSIHVGVEQKYWPFNLVKLIHKNEYPIRRYHLIWFMQIQVCSDFAVCFQYVSQLLGKYLYRSWCLVYSNYVNFVMGYNPKVFIYIYISIHQKFEFSTYFWYFCCQTNFFI